MSLDNHFSYDDCIQSCIESIYTNKNICFPNPFITEDSILLNSNQINIFICNSTQNQTILDTKDCTKKCAKDCTQVYYVMNVKMSYSVINFESKIERATLKGTTELRNYWYYWYYWNYGTTGTTGTTELQNHQKPLETPRNHQYGSTYL